MEKKYVYLFKEGNANMKELLGGKGANLAEMTSLGMPIPQGFTITTESCNKYYDDDEQISKEILQQIDSALLYLEEQTGKKLGSKAIIGFCKIWSKSFYARNDGYCIKFRYE